MSSSDFGFYGILTDPVLGYEELATIMVAKRVPYIQLRMKGCPREEILATAVALRKIIKGPSRFIINDDVEMALQIEADGVHIGQDDTPYAEARKILGPKALIGISTHNPDQTRQACLLKPDYIGVGPVFPTPTKAIPDPVLGIEGMSKMISLATVPAIAIGGIDLGNLEKVKQAGARNWCAVRCICASTNPGPVLDQLLER